MVHIAAPALAATEADVPASDSGGSPATDASGGRAAHMATCLGSHTFVWGFCGAVLLLAGTMLIALLRSDPNSIATRPPVGSGTLSNTENSAESGQYGEVRDNYASPSDMAAEQPSAEQLADHPSARERTPEDAAFSSEPGVLNLPPLPSAGPTTEEPPPVVVAGHEEAADANEPSSEHPGIPTKARRRKLRLEPLEFDPVQASLTKDTQASSVDEPASFSPNRGARTAETPTSNAIEPQGKNEEASDDASPKLATDIPVQMATRVEAIDVPAMPLEEFLAMVSAMAAVSIEIDSTAGISPELAVSARGRNLTLAELLDQALKPQDLAVVERGHSLVVVARTRD